MSEMFLLSESWKVGGRQGSMGCWLVGLELRGVVGILKAMLLMIVVKCSRNKYFCIDSPAHYLGIAEATITIAMFTINYMFIPFS